jgi:hypothetical protein
MTRGVREPRQFAARAPMPGRCRGGGEEGAEKRGATETAGQKRLPSMQPGLPGAGEVRRRGSRRCNK